jgi:predicted RecA/RadA family phage recombinase
MRNFIQPGKTITVPSPGSVESGDVVIIGGLAGVASGDAETGEDLDLALEGVYTLPKSSAVVLTVGELALWDGAQVVDSESDGDAIGHVIEAAGSGVTTCLVRLSN